MARVLMQACISTLKATGQTAVALWVDADNTPALALHQSLGFEV